MYNVCKNVFPDWTMSQVMRGCLQVFYVPGVGYISVPILVSDGSGGHIDLDKISLIGLGVHVVCAINTVRITVGP
jgi:hypothetical protein